MRWYLQNPAHWRTNELYTQEYAVHQKREYEKGKLLHMIDYSVWITQDGEALTVIPKEDSVDTTIYVAMRVLENILLEKGLKLDSSLVTEDNIL